MKEMPPSGRAIVDEVIDHRRHLHQHPEVAFEEHRTSEYIRNRLAALDLEMREGPTETGAVAVLRTGRPGHTVMLRADIDALAIHEESGFPSNPRSRAGCTAAGMMPTPRSCSAPPTTWPIGQRI